MLLLLPSRALPIGRTAGLSLHRVGRRPQRKTRKGSLSLMGLTAWQQRGQRQGNINRLSCKSQRRAFFSVGQKLFKRTK